MWVGHSCPEPLTLKLQFFVGPSFWRSAKKSVVLSCQKLNVRSAGLLPRDYFSVPLDFDLDATAPDFTAAASSDQSGVCDWLSTELAWLN